jgi:[amino group carrier protein]-6-phospho-L-2-aminoadipate/5-phospho-L-glutamate reductase
VQGTITPDHVRALYAEAYRGEPFVRVPQKRLPEVVAVAGSNFAEVAVEVGPAFGGTRVVTAFSVTDNLIKGGAGQAIQSMNLMLGLDERTTLEDTGPWP